MLHCECQHTDHVFILLLEADEYVQHFNLPASTNVFNTSDLAMV